MEPSARQRKSSLLHTSPVEKPPDVGAQHTSPALVSYNQVPDWYRDNHFIRHGYRPVSNSARACVASWCYLHNESVNIFTHLLPALFFLVAEHITFQDLQAQYPNATLGDRLIFAFFLLTATLCLGISAIFHTLMNHSMPVCQFWLQLDFIGILVLTLGDFVSGIYMIFYCEPVLKRVYWGMILSLASLTMLILINPRFQGRQWRTLRVCAFVGTGLSGFAPIIHGIAIFGIPQIMAQSGMPFYLLEGFFLLLGVFFYATRIPESLKPGRFDIFGSSHQIFHVLVVLATVSQFIGILSAFDYNYHHRSCPIS